MGKKFFSKNFKKVALSLAGVLFAGSLVGSALTYTGKTASADDTVNLLYSSADFNVEEDATYTDDTGKTGVKLTAKKSGTDAEGSSFTIGESFTGDFSLDFRVTSQNAYTTSHATHGYTHYVATGGRQKYAFSDNMNPYLDLKEVAFTFTSRSNPDKYFTVYFYGAHAELAFITTAYVYVPGDTCYMQGDDGIKRYGYALASTTDSSNDGEITNEKGTYSSTTENSTDNYVKRYPEIYGTSFSNYGATSSGDKTSATTVSNMLAFDAEEMKIYVNAGTGYGSSKVNTTADVLVRDVAENVGAENSTLTFGSVSKDDFADGYTVTTTYTDVTANASVGATTYVNSSNTKVDMFAGIDHYAQIIDTAYDRYPAMTIYSVNGNSVGATDIRSMSYISASDLVTYDESEITVTEEFVDSRVEDSRLGLNFKSVQSGTDAEGAGFAFNNTVGGDFEIDFRVTSEQAYTPKHETAGYTHYISNNDNARKKAMSDNVNPYLDLKEVAFTFTSATDTSKYFTVYFRGAQSTTAFSTTAYVYVHGDTEDTGAYMYGENGECVYGYGLSNGGKYPWNDSTSAYADVNSHRAYWNAMNIWGTSFSNYTATSSSNKAMGALTSNLLKFDVDTMSVYVNSGTGYNKTNTSADKLLRDLATNSGANPDLALGSLSKSDFENGYTVSVEFTDVTANDCTGWTSSDFPWSDYDHYCTNPTTEYDRCASMTVYSINGQSFDYDEAGNSESGIESTVAPVLFASTAEMLVGSTVDVTPMIYSVIGGNGIGTYGTVSYTTDDGASYTAIEKNSTNCYIFTPNELGSYMIVYEGFKDSLGKLAETFTVTRECGLGFAMELGASVRMATDGTSGIRFTGSISKDGYDWLVAKYGDNLTFKYSITSNNKTLTQTVEADKTIYDESAQAYIMRAAVVGISETQYENVWSATLFAEAEDDTYVATSNDNERKIVDIARKAVSNDEYYSSLLSWQKSVIGKYAGYYGLEASTGNVYTEGHAQGTASSDGGRYIYHSIKTVIAKQDVATGEIVGSLVGATTVMGNCHIGDITYLDGKLYATLIRNDTAIDNCYILIIEAAALVGEKNFTDTYVDNGVEKPIAKIAYIGAPIRTNFSSQSGVGDYANVSGFGGKYGVVNSVDSVTVGPAFGADDNGEYYLTLGLCMPAMAVTTDSLSGDGTTVTADARTDNDYLVIAQYDISEVEAVAVEFSATGDALFSSAVENAGASLAFENTYFFYMGYHNYGLQNITYDSYKDAYICTPYGVVTGSEFPNYQFFVVSAHSYAEGTLAGNGVDTGKIVSALCGVVDETTGVVGYTNYWGVGVVSLGNGYYYLNTHTTETVDDVTCYGSRSNLYKWDETLDASTTFPFVRVY